LLKPAESNFEAIPMNGAAPGTAALAMVVIQGATFFAKEVKLMTIFLV
jgi:hypothetical protein